MWENKDGKKVKTLKHTDIHRFPSGSALGRSRSFSGDPRRSHPWVIGGLEQMEIAQQQQSIWGHLPLLVGSSSKESVEYILQALWRTRRTGLDSADRIIIRDMLHLPDDSDLDPLLLCLRILIRRCVYDNISKDEIQKLFPEEVLPELKRLLTLLLQKFQREWREDIQNEQGSLPHLKAMTGDMANEKEDSTGQVPVVNMELQSDNQRLSGETEIKFQLEKDALETMLKSMYSISDHWSNGSQSSKDGAPNGTAQQSEAVGT